MRKNILAYQKVHDLIKHDILSSIYEIGYLLPNELELEEKYDVSRSTIRKAIKLLVEEGYLDVKQGRGTLVKDYMTRQDYTHVTSVTESLKKRGYTVEIKKMHIEVEIPPESIAQKLNLSDNEKVAHIQRIELANGNPICIMENFIPYKKVIGIEIETEIVSLYQFLEEKYGIEIEYTNDVIDACAADFYEADVLNVNVGMPILRIARVGYDKNREPLCYDKVKILGNRYKVEITGSGRKK